VIAVAARWLLPLFAAWLDRRYGVALADYQALATSTFVVLTNPMILGAVVGLLLLDEQDEGSLTALRVTPLGMARYIAWRTAAPVALCMAFSFASVVIVAPVFEAPPPGPLAMLAVAFLAALGTPLMALAVASVATNKVEGLAVIKGLGFLILAAFIAWWVPWPWRWLFGLFPTWWPTEAYWRFAGEPGPGGPWLVWGLGLVVHAALLWALGRRFARRV
jgi:fluoroquinolone transport system permease protein